MPILTLKFKKNKIADYPVTKGQSITIGRRNENDIVIENLAVSGHHAKIDSIGDGFVITDLQSKNGCFVNEQLITSHWLKHGDVVNIGKHTLVFSYREGESRRDEYTPGMDQTMVMDTSRYRDMVSKNTEKAPQPQSAKMQPQSAKMQPQPAKVQPQPAKVQSVGVLSYLSGGEGEISLSKKLIKIGKDAASDVIVGGFGVGHTAATISMRPNGYYISHVGGLSKIKLNGAAIKESKQLKEFDVIELGSAKLQFFTKE
jgi:pSer/pThr/pTyr-binding forkhead associated (FHA) protein